MLTDLPAELRDYVEALPEPLRSRVAEKLADPKRLRAVHRGRCPFEGPVINRWPSDCSEKVELYSVRQCNHPQQAGQCSRGENAAHKLAGVRICHARDCPLIQSSAAATSAQNSGDAR
jgi:hypothetical protein